MLALIPRPAMPSSEEVERALVDHYLSSEGPGGAGPLTFIDATGEALGEALGAPNPETATAWLVHACGGAVLVARVLKHGWPDTRTATKDVPGHFRFLVLACAVVARAHDADKQEFGHNLRLMLASGMAFNERQALPNLWKHLADWCGRRHATGEAIRGIVLPSPAKGDGRHVGITKAMAFPNWQSIKRLREDLAARPALAAAASSTGSTALEICPRVVVENRYSQEMTAAARSFQAAYRRGDTLLHLHRFWTVVRHAARAVRQREVRSPLQVRLELLDGATEGDVQVRLDVSSRGVSPDLFDGAPTRAFERIVALDGRSGEIWKRMVRNGAVPFEEERFLVWTGTAAVPDRDARHRYLVLAGIADRVPEEWRSRFRRLDGESEWFHLGPVRGEEAARLHVVLGIETAPVRPIRLANGIRTVGGWLGRPAFLPLVHRSGTGRVDVRSVDRGTAVEAVETGPGRLKLSASAAVDGLYRLRLSETSGDGETVGVESLIRFVADAPIHSRLLPPPRGMLPSDAECGVSAQHARQSTASQCPSLEGQVAWQAFDDLLEAVYARGRHGWKEVDLVGLIRELCPGPSPWDVLRGLQEAGWLERRISESWRAVGWFLLPSVVVPLADGLSALEGSAPVAVRKRFAAVAEDLSAETSCRPGVGPCSVPSLLSRGVDPGVLADRLGWQLASPARDVPLKAPSCWTTPRLSLAGLVPFRTWSWEAAAFRETKPDDGGIFLAWHRRLEGDRHDVYAVGRYDLAFLTSSRVVAIAEAHRRAGVPLFGRVEDRWVRRATEGHLPLPLARGLHRTAQCAAGPAYVDGRWTYAYAREGSRPATEVLGLSLFAGDPEAGPAAGKARSPRSIGLARHRVDGWSRFIGSFRQKA